MKKVAIYFIYRGEVKKIVSSAYKTRREAMTLIKACYPGATNVSIIFFKEIV